MHGVSWGFQRRTAYLDCSANASNTNPTQIYMHRVDGGDRVSWPVRKRNRLSDSIRYDTIEEFNVVSKAEYRA